MGGSSQSTYCRIGDRYPRRAGQEFICCSYTFGAGLPLAPGLDGVALLEAAPPFLGRPRP